MSQSFRKETNISRMKIISNIIYAYLKLEKIYLHALVTRTLESFLSIYININIYLYL